MQFDDRRRLRISATKCGETLTASLDGRDGEIPALNDFSSILAFPAAVDYDARRRYFRRLTSEKLP